MTKYFAETFMSPAGEANKKQTEDVTPRAVSLIKCFRPSFVANRLPIVRSDALPGSHPTLGEQCSCIHRPHWTFTAISVDRDGSVRRGRVPAKAPNLWAVRAGADPVSLHGAAVGAAAARNLRASSPAGRHRHAARRFRRLHLRQLPDSALRELASWHRRRQVPRHWMAHLLERAVGMHVDEQCLARNWPSRALHCQLPIPSRVLTDC